MAYRGPILRHVLADTLKDAEDLLRATNLSSVKVVQVQRVGIKWYIHFLVGDTFKAAEKELLEIKSEEVAQPTKTEAPPRRKKKAKKKVIRSVT